MSSPVENEDIQRSLVVFLRSVADTTGRDALALTVEIGLVEVLKDGPSRTNQLANATGCDEVKLLRLLRLLARLQVVLPEGENWRLGPCGSLLSSTHPQSIRYELLAWSYERELWGQAATTMREPVDEADRGKRYFDAVAARPDLFAARMRQRTAFLFEPIITSFDWPTTGHVTDVGGSDGWLLRQVIADRPELTGTVVDLYAEPTVQHDRIDHVVMDFMVEALPPSDTILLANVLHDWDDRTSLHLLGRCRAALRPGGRIIVLDLLVQQQMAALGSDVSMMVLTGGRERDLPDWQDLARQSELRLQVAGGEPATGAAAFVMTPDTR